MTRITVARHTTTAYENKSAFFSSWSVISDLTQNKYFNLLATLSEIQVSKFTLADPLRQSNGCALLIKLLECSPIPYFSIPSTCFLLQWTSTFGFFFFFLLIDSAYQFSQIIHFTDFCPLSVIPSICLPLVIFRLRYFSNIFQHIITLWSLLGYSIKLSYLCLTPVPPASCHASVASSSLLCITSLLAYAYGYWPTF